MGYVLSPHRTAGARRMHLGLTSGRMRSRRGLLLALVFCLRTGTMAGAEPELSRFEFLEIRMGIPVNMVLYAADSAVAGEASRAAYTRIREIDRIMSDYDPDSELRRLCASAQPGRPQPVSAELFHVLQQAQEMSRRSEGAFDVTVGPAVKLWRGARRRKELPEADRLAEAMNAVGYQHMALDAEGMTVTLHRPGMQIDLGAIAKGYAADQALRVLRHYGITRALVEAGGDLAVGDPPPDRQGWRVEIEKVRGEEGKALVLHLANSAVATSGDAYQFLEVNGVRYSHLLDPKTGLGVTRPGSVTVIARDCLTADGLASAVTVLGPERGLPLIEQTPGTAALVVLSPPAEAPQETVKRLFTSGFRDFILPAARDTP